MVWYYGRGGNKRAKIFEDHGDYKIIRRRLLNRKFMYTVIKKFNTRNRKGYVAIFERITSLERARSIIRGRK